MTSVYLLNFGEDLTIFEHKPPCVISSLHGETLPEYLRFTGSIRIKTFKRINGITIKNLAVYKEIDEEIEQP